MYKYDNNSSKGQWSKVADKAGLFLNMLNIDSAEQMEISSWL